MSYRFEAIAYSLTPIADTSGEFADFAPYVPSIDDEGEVAFQATLRTGGSGVFETREGKITPVVEPGSVLADVVSHPDVDGTGRACFYAASATDGGRAVFVIEGRELIRIADRAGPLGPTMNDDAQVAFRAEIPGGEGVFLWRDREVERIADTTGPFASFQGLPVVNNLDHVLIRADLQSGGQSINLVNERGSLSVIAATGDTYASLNFFPTMNDEGMVGFCGTTRSGGSGAYMAHRGQIHTIADSTGPFESFRTVLLDRAGRALLCGTPRDGTLGVFSGPDPGAHRVLAIGDAMNGSTIVEFALNPVSINQRGQFAIRVKLADGRQLILRGDHA